MCVVIRAIGYVTHDAIKQSPRASNTGLFSRLLTLSLASSRTRVDPVDPCHTIGPHRFLMDQRAVWSRVAPRHANNITSLTCKGPAQDVCRTRVSPRHYTNDTQGAAWTCKQTNTQKTITTHFQHWTSLWALSPSSNKINFLQNGPARDPRGPAF